jgi:hypothetical protein
MALPLSERLQNLALIVGGGLSRQSLGRRPWRKTFKAGGPRMHRNINQPVQGHWKQDFNMMRGPNDGIREPEAGPQEGQETSQPSPPSGGNEQSWPGGYGLESATAR